MDEGKAKRAGWLVVAWLSAVASASASTSVASVSSDGRVAVGSDSELQGPALRVSCPVLQQALQARVAELAADVENVVGASLDAVPEVVGVDEASFGEWVSWRRDVAFFGSSGQQAEVGAYDPLNRRIVVRCATWHKWLPNAVDAAELQTDLFLAHEIAHAVADQRWQVQAWIDRAEVLDPLRGVLSEAFAQATAARVVWAGSPPDLVVLRALAPRPPQPRKTHGAALEEWAGEVGGAYVAGYLDGFRWFDGLEHTGEAWEALSRGDLPSLAALLRGHYGESLGACDVPAGLVEAASRALGGEGGVGEARSLAGHFAGLGLVYLDEATRRAVNEGYRCTFRFVLEGSDVLRALTLDVADSVGALHGLSGLAHARLAARENGWDEPRGGLVRIDEWTVGGTSVTRYRQRPGGNAPPVAIDVALVPVGEHTFARWEVVRRGDVVVDVGREAHDVITALPALADAAARASGVSVDGP